MSSSSITSSRSLNHETTTMDPVLNNNNNMNNNILDEGGSVTSNCSSGGSSSAAAAAIVITNSKPNNVHATTTAASHMRTSKRQPKANAGKNGGRWTQKEHQDFLVGLTLYGREWKRVARHIRTRTSAQIRSHAQKYFAKLGKSNNNNVVVINNSRGSHKKKGTTPTSVNVNDLGTNNGYSSSMSSPGGGGTISPEAQQHNWKAKFIIRNSIAKKERRASSTPSEKAAAHVLHVAMATTTEPATVTKEEFIDRLSPVTKHKVLSLEDDELCAVHVLSTYHVGGGCVAGNTSF